jgi:hypothetical protein
VTETEKDRRAVRFVPRGDLKILDPIRTTAYIARNQDGMPCTSRTDRDRKLACQSGNRAARDDDKDGRAVVDWLRAKGGSKSELERFSDLLDHGRGGSGGLEKEGVIVIGSF